ncbi:threonine-phosphate decarboxylase [Shimia ponticola]|uniref:threonine-phosphate decarboxylase n=1 Tax=Shimia ponticola TaxID=2582893 RepID=UPI0011BEAAE7|nr:threonine-phosphate decarboxylase [Shimia ponticola]
MTGPRDHGGGIDAARAHYGGARQEWIDLSTGINPHPYPVADLPADAWTALPDAGAMEQLLSAARSFWSVPETAAIMAAPGASAIIAQIPFLRGAGRVSIPSPTYNEHAASFRIAGWTVLEAMQEAEASVVVHPNNPDGAFHTSPDADLVVIDESFCDVAPDRSLITEATRPGRIILKSFGKFWGLAGMRLGFAIGDPDLIGTLKDRLGPWAVAGPALATGAAALNDGEWAEATRLHLTAEAARLDDLMIQAGARVVGGTSLFRLYDTDDAARWQDALARNHIWSRIFPYSKTWLRLGLPPADGWERLTQAVSSAQATARR